jgi:hypothetical protein
MKARIGEDGDGDDARLEPYVIRPFPDLLGQRHVHNLASAPGGGIYVCLCFLPRRLHKEHTLIPLSQLQPVEFSIQQMHRCQLVDTLNGASSSSSQSVH